MNFKAQVLTNFPCWKHGENTIVNRTIESATKSRETINSNDVRFVVGVKHPIDWLLSLWKYENHIKGKQPQTFVEFLDTPAWTYRDARLHATDAYNKMLPSWFALDDSPRNFQMVRQEEMEQGQLALLERIRDQMGLEMKLEAIQVSSKRILPGGKVTDQDYIKDSLHENVDEEAFGIIESRLNPAIVNRLGYILTSNPQGVSFPFSC